MTKYNIGRKWAVVATVSEPLPLLIAFTSHHLAAGADQVILYLDDPDQEVGSTLNIASNCTAIQCDNSYWATHAKDGRPTDHRLRQTINANNAFKQAQTDWLIHLDADEFLVSTNNIADELAALNPGIEVAQVSNLERVYLRGAKVGNIFEGLARAPIRTRILSFMLYRRASKFMRRGMIGHSNGKSFLRTESNNRMGIHRPEKPAKTVLLRSTTMIHFDGLTRMHWIDKLYAKTITSSDLTVHKRSVARRALISFAAGPGLVREKMDRLFSEVMELSALKASVMRWLGGLYPIKLRITEEIAEIYAGQTVDISRNSFDNSLANKTRAVMYRGVEFHVNLLQNFTERLIGVKGETREEKELDYLIDRFKGKTATFFDIGANIGLYTIVLASQLSPDSKVIAVECSPILLTRLRRNIEANKLHNVSICEVAISNLAGTAKLNIVKTGNLGQASLQRPKNNTTHPTIDVQTITLLECMDRFGVHQIDFLKVDIEGHEPTVMNHFFDHSTRGRYPHVVLLEMKHDLKQVDELHDMMIFEGYITLFETGNNRIYSLLGG